ncbi:MAG: general secretion pathway protein GspK [Myxococcales bacterium]
MPRTRHSKGRANARGVALILVLTTIAILTSIGVDFSYGSRVNLRLAENARDELRAFYLARSAVNLSRLLLHFQRQLDQTGGAIANKLLPQGTAAPAPGSGARQPLGAQPTATTPGNNLGIRLWEVLPIDSNVMTALLGGGDLAALGVDQMSGARRENAPLPAAGAAPMHSFGAFDGAFSSKIEDENSRINVRALDGLGDTPRAIYTQLMAMIGDPKFDFIFDEPDANNDRVRREDVIVALKDWIDIDENGAAIDPSIITGNPFVNASGDENSAYDRYEPRYKAKNASFDSLGELFMVRGVNDRFMAAFGDRLTVWLGPTGKLNVNTDDPKQMITNILAAAKNPADPRLRNPKLLETVLQAITMKKMFSFFGLSAADFVKTLQESGIEVNPVLTNPTAPGNFLTSTSDTFRIVATGRVGRTDKRLTAVVHYDDQLGKLLYWKED